MSLKTANEHDGLKLFNGSQKTQRTHTHTHTHTPRIPNNECSTLHPELQPQHRAQQMFLILVINPACRVLGPCLREDFVLPDGSRIVLACKLINPKPINPKPINPKPINPKLIKSKPMNPKPLKPADPKPVASLFGFLVGSGISVCRSVCAGRTPNPTAAIIL